MRIPAPIYANIPQTWILMGGLLIATGLYFSLFPGFNFPLIVRCQLVVGICCCAYGVGIYLMRSRHKVDNSDPDPLQNG